MTNTAKIVVNPDRLLKLATWNIEWLNDTPGQGKLKRTDQDYERLRSYAKKLDADLVALQEVNGAEAARRVFDEQEYSFHFSARANVQNTGFAYRKTLSVTLYPDIEDLNLEGTLRSGVDLAVHVEGLNLRVLSVHLKSGCFFEPLSTPGRACSKLQAQLPILERWIDARALEAQPFLVLGDFNRRLNPQDPFWEQIDDSVPPNADLHLATANLRSQCRGAKYPELIDHIVLSRDAAPLLDLGSVQQLLYSDLDRLNTLSDHCPVAARLRVPANAARGQSPPTPTPQVRGPEAHVSGNEPPPQLRVKGNIGAARKKLYHLPNCPSYERTVVDEARGERYFSTETEAIAAGWSKAGSCPD
ncbi:MAG: hypothetical protein RJA70_3109 [Pseudomonadota bacterium]|jgi:endonuclease/exonuclease/phosphatase family metal-dependent hydrolase